MKGNTQVLPAAGPDTVLQMGLAVVGVVVVVVVVVVLHTMVVQTSCWAELHTQVLQSTKDRAPGVQVPGARVVVVPGAWVVVVVVPVVDSSWQDEAEEITQSPQLLVTTAPELSVAVAHQGREESA